MKTPTRIAAATCLALLVAATATVAQAPGIKRTLLQRIDIGNNMEVVIGIAEIAPGGSTGRHTHFGIESGYTISGQASLEVEGEAPKLLDTGASYVIPAGKVHDAKVVGDALNGLAWSDDRLIVDLHCVKCWAGRCRFAVCVDSGVQHLASAVGTPAISLFSFWQMRGCPPRVCMRTPA